MGVNIAKAIADGASEDDLRRLRAWEIAARALIRGGHRDEPSIDAQMAAANWVIAQQLSVTLLDAVESGDHGACLRIVDGTLLFVADAEDGGAPIEIDLGPDG